MSSWSCSVEKAVGYGVGVAWQAEDGGGGVLGGRHAGSSRRMTKDLLKDGPGNESR